MDRQMDRQTDRQTDRQRSFRPTRLGRVSRLLHQGSGCVTLVDGLLVRHKPSGRETVLGHGVQAVATDGDGLLIVEGKRLRVLDAKDQVRESLPIGSGVTAVVRMGSRFVVGYKDGGLELLGTGEGAPSFSSFEGTLASPVVRLIPGPRGTLVAGYGNGNVGLWSLRAGARLVHAKLHGSIQHLRLLGSHLVIASELGQHRKLDLSIFQQPYCDLLRTLWREIPILWQGGLPRLAEPPANHRCAIGPAP